MGSVVLQPSIGEDHAFADAEPGVAGEAQRRARAVVEPHAHFPCAAALQFGLAKRRREDAPQLAQGLRASRRSVATAGARSCAGAFGAGLAVSDGAAGGIGAGAGATGVTAGAVGSAAVTMLSPGERESAGSNTTLVGATGVRHNGNQPSIAAMPNPAASATTTAATMIA